MAANWFGSGGGFGNIFGQIGTAILGSLITGFMTQGLNQMFGERPPSRGDVTRDLMSQADILRGAQTPIRTPEQEASDKAALEVTAQRQATFSQMSQELADLQAKGATYDPYEEARIREQTMADAAIRGVSESGQTQNLLNQRLDEARLRRTDLHQRRVNDLRQAMIPYSGVVPPGSPPISTPPSVSPLPRTTGPPPFSAAPLDLVSALGPGEEPKSPEEEKRKQALSLYGTPRSSTGGFGPSYPTQA